MGLVVVGSRFPRTLRTASERCIRCGHCVAACPVQLLLHEGLPAEPCLPLDADWRGTPSAVGQLIRGRRSIRHYQPKTVERSVLLSVLDAARYAPTAMNSQSVKWMVVYSEGEVKKLSLAVIDWMRELMRTDDAVAGRYSAATLVAAWDAGLDPILRGSPHVLVAYGAQDDPMAFGSCMIALTTADLAAQPLGLGTCWAGFLHLAARSSPAVQEALGLPAGHVMHGGLMIGYPAETYQRIPPRKPLTVDWR
jgi:nitroreductase